MSINGQLLRDAVISGANNVRNKRVEVDEAKAGDIVALMGLQDAEIGETIADKDNPEASFPTFRTARLSAMWLKKPLQRCSAVLAATRA